jgi:hypothetical protein
MIANPMSAGFARDIGQLRNSPESLPNRAGKIGGALEGSRFGSRVVGYSGL